MAHVTMTSNQIVARILHSNLPIVLVEGDDDMDIFRNVKKKLAHKDIDIFPCGGRNTMIEVFRRRSEFSTKHVHFFADQDMWVFSGIPPEFDQMMFTTGYSLENDLYYDGHEMLESLLDADELIKKNEILVSTSRWFAFEVEQHLRGMTSANAFGDVSLLNTSTMPMNGTLLSNGFLQQRNYSPASTHLENMIADMKFSCLRGKFIFQAYFKIFEHFRKMKDREAVTYAIKHLRDLCYREGAKDFAAMTRMNTIIQTIRDKFS